MRQWPGILGVFVIVGCRPEPSAPVAPTVAIASFRGYADPAAGRLDFEPFDSTGRGLGLLRIVQDGIPGSGPPDSVELVTLGAGVDWCGPGTFGGDVQLNGFYAGRVSNLAVQIRTLAPITGHEPLNADPPFLGLDNTLGLWRYPRFGVTVRWCFEHLAPGGFEFTGVVWGDVESAVIDRDQDGVEEGRDCDDWNRTVHPGAPELCDGFDNDCDGVVPERVVRWPMEGSLAETVQAYPLAPSGSLTYGPGACGAGLELRDGAYAYADDDGTLSEFYPSGFTVALWGRPVRCNVGGGDPFCPYVSKGQAGHAAPEEYAIGTQSDLQRSHLAVNWGADHILVESPHAPMSGWHAFVGVVDPSGGGETRLYLDGALAGSNPAFTAMAFAGNRLTLGTNPAGGHEYGDLDVDEVQIFACPLLGPAIRAHFTCGGCGCEGGARPCPDDEVWDGAACVPAAGPPVDHPVPVLDAIDPATVTAGAPDLSLALLGSSFVPGAVVEVDGVPVSTAYVSPTELTATVPAGALASAGDRSVLVRNPAPGGGPSAPRVLTVDPPACTVRGLRFDGVDDWVSVPAVPATTAFTLEAWLRGAPTTTAKLFGTLCGAVWWGAAGLWLEVFPSCNGTSARYTNDNAPIPFSAPASAYHLALVVSASNQAALYLNGQPLGAPSLQYDPGVAGTYVGTLAATRDARLPQPGSFAQVDFAGFRASNGARYSSAFTPPEPLVADANTTILYTMTEGEGSSLLDGSGHGRHGVITGATWIREGSCGGGGAPGAPPFAIASTELAASLSCGNAGFGLGTADWTFESWIRVHHDFATPGNWGGSPDGMIFTQNEAYAAYAIRPQLDNGGQIRSYTYNDSSGAHNIAHWTASLDDGAWHHYALVRAGSTATTFVDGVVAGTQSGVAPELRATSPMAIGVPSGYASYYTAPVALGPIRFSSGVRYVGPFTPAPSWPVDGQTIAQYLTTQPFDGATLVDEAGGDNSCTHRRGWVAETP